MSVTQIFQMYYYLRIGISVAYLVRELLINGTIQYLNLYCNFLNFHIYIKIGMEEKIHKEVDFTIQHIKDLIGTKNETTMPKGANHKLR